MVMLVDLFAFCRLGPLGISLFDIRLKGRYLFIDMRNVLFDNEGEFLLIILRIQELPHNAWLSCNAR